MDNQRDEVADLIDRIARSLADQPDEVSVAEFEEDQDLVIELKVAPEDLGQIIGRQGRMARAMRTLLGAAGLKRGRRYILEILE